MGAKWQLCGMTESWDLLNRTRMAVGNSVLNLDVLRVGFRCAHHSGNYVRRGGVYQLDGCDHVNLHIRSPHRTP